MKHFFLIILSVLTCLPLLWSCSEQGTSIDLGTPAYTPRHATSFEIYDAGESSSILRIFNPWQGARDITRDLFISRNNELPPEGFEGAVITATPKKVVCMSTSHIAFIDAVNGCSSIKGVSGTDFVSNESVRAAIERKEVADVGYDANVNYELIASIAPDIVFIYGIAGENTTMVNKLTEMNIPAFYICDYLEQTPLGKSEWVVAFGEIYGNRGEAEKLFDEIEQNYNDIKNRAAEYTSRPKVMLNAPYRDTWFVPGDRSYVVTLINDAGGEYICGGHDNEISRPLSSEAAYLHLCEADIWLNPNQAESIAELAALNPKFADTPVMKNHNVYNNTNRTTKAGGSDFWESGALRADVVLADMLHILHPESNINHELFYFKRLY